MFYVYVYRDSRPNKNLVPIYVGKGHGDRSTYHWDKTERCHNQRLRNLLNLYKREGLEPSITIVFTTDNEVEAFNKERELIQLFGRADLGKGSLFNLTDGGEGTVNLSLEAKTRQIESSIKTKNSSEGKLRASVASLGIWKNEHIRAKIVEKIRLNAQNPEYRKKLSFTISKARGTEESRLRTSIASTTMWQTKEYRDTWNKSHSEAINTPEELKRKGKATKRGWDNPETRRLRTEGIKRGRSTEESRAKTRAQQATQWTDENRKAASELAKIKLSDPLVKIRSRVANAYNWCKRQGRPYSDINIV